MEDDGMRLNVKNHQWQFFSFGQTWRSGNEASLAKSKEEREREGGKGGIGSV